MADNLEPLEAKTEFLTIGSLIEKVSKQKKINLNPTYQRDVVWTEAKMSAFIDSLMRGYIPSNLTINVESGSGEWICVDGKQRINSILNFCKNVIPWTMQDENDEDHFIYFSDVPGNKKDIQNYRQFDKKEQKEFLQKKLIVVTYQNLDYNTQCEIFNRIQNAMSSTSGEQCLSLFRNQEVASKFKEFCRVHDYMKKARFRNVDVLMNIMYMTKNKELKVIAGRKEKKKFIEELDDMNEYMRLTKLVEKNLKVFFSEKLMAHKKILDKKMTKNFIMVIYYLLATEKTTKMTEYTDDHYPKIRRMIIKIWNKWNIVDGDINKERAKTAVKVLQKIENLYKDYSAVMQDLDGEEDDNSNSDNDNDRTDSDDSSDNSDNSDDSDEDSDGEVKDKRLADMMEDDSDNDENNEVSDEDSEDEEEDVDDADESEEEETEVIKKTKHKKSSSVKQQRNTKENKSTKPASTISTRDIVNVVKKVDSTKQRGGGRTVIRKKN